MTKNIIEEPIIETNKLKFKPYIFHRGGIGGRVSLCCCMECKHYKKCKKRIKLRDILLETIDRIYEETDVKIISDLSLYSITSPTCESGE